MYYYYYYYWNKVFFLILFFLLEDLASTLLITTSLFYFYQNVCLEETFTMICRKTYHLIGNFLKEPDQTSFIYFSPPYRDCCRKMWNTSSWQNLTYYKYNLKFIQNRTCIPSYNSKISSCSFSNFFKEDFILRPLVITTGCGVTLGSTVRLLKEEEPVKLFCWYW